MERRVPWLWHLLFYLVARMDCEPSVWEKLASWGVRGVITKRKLLMITVWGFKGEDKVWRIYGSLYWVSAANKALRKQEMFRLCSGSFYCFFFLDSCCIQILCLCTQLPSHPLTAFVGPLLGVDVAQWLIGRALGRLDLHLAVWSWAFCWPAFGPYSHVYEMEEIIIPPS